MYKKMNLLLTLAFVAMLVLSACVAPAGAPAAGGDGDAMASGPVVLNLNAGTEPPSLDPSLGTDTTSIGIINEMFLGLTELDPDTK